VKKKVVREKRRKVKEEADMKKITILHLVCVIVATAILSTGAVSFAADRSIAVREKEGAAAVSFSGVKYHAIVIGNNDYKYLPRLQTAVNDANDVAKLLKSKYGFEARVLLNATRNDILTAINDLRKTLTDKDNLLIYYAGHGEFDKVAGKSYWLPVDAKRDNPVDWIMAEDITSNIKRIASPHILVISDSCYSGTLTRAATTDLSANAGREEFLKKMVERPSRTLMASGGNEPVADSGGGGKHSVFAAALLSALNEANNEMFTAEEIFHGRVKEIVAGKSDQVPQYENIKNSGHEGGDFVFHIANAAPAKAVAKPTAPTAAAQPEVKLKEASDEEFSLGDIKEKGEASKAKWNERLLKMQNAYFQVKEYENQDVPTELKAAAWNKFLAVFKDKNPYSNTDESMRNDAKGRVEYWLNYKTPAAPPAQVARAEQPRPVIKSPETPVRRADVRKQSSNSTDYSVIHDAQTGLEWVVGPDQDMTWEDASAWVATLTVDGGGWRMPTSAELDALYRPNSGDRNMPPEFKTTGWYVWSGEGSALGHKGVRFGTGDMQTRYGGGDRRAFAVRSKQ
jgi:uncharacterized caspase-like protein